MENNQRQETDSSNKIDKYEKEVQLDYYTMLEIDKTASQAEIKTKYNELLLLYHPDKGGDAKKFKNLQLAYKILTDPKKRGIYNKSLSSTFSEITKDYYDHKTGKRINLGYDVNFEDFNRGPIEDR